MTRRRGFTLIEMLTVVSIIAVLIALLLPAIFASRQAARLTRCRNNLLQLGLALGNYASTHGVFPPGVVEPRGPIDSAPIGYHVGWVVQILPYIEQTNRFHRIDFRQGVHAPANVTALTGRIRLFLCPSDRLIGPMNYKGCHHDVEAPIDVDNHGLLYLNSHIEYDNITDGAAHTILLGEAQNWTSSAWAPGTRETLRNTGHPISANGGPVPAPLVPPPAGWPLLPPTFVGGFSSHHPGGANFLLADGSAHYIRQLIHPEIFRRLGNRSDGELIGDDQY